MAASFIRKAVSDAHEISNLINIPNMKRERDAIRDRIYVVSEAIKNETALDEHKSTITSAIDALSKLNRANVFSDDDSLTQSQNVLAHLNKRQNEHDQKIIALQIEHQGLNFELDKLVNKIKKARNP